MAAIFRVKRHIEDEPLNAFVLNCKKRKCDTVGGGGGGNLGEQASGSSASTFGISQNDETSKTIVKFAGTVDTQEETVSHLTKLTKAKAIETTKRIRPPVQNFTTKNRQDHRQQSHENRFKIVNCSRTTDISVSGNFVSVATSENASSSILASAGSGSGQKEQNVTVVDIEKSISPKLLTSPTAAAATIMTNTQHSDNINHVSSQQSNPVLEDDSSNYVYDLYVADDAENVDFNDDLVENLLSVQPFDDLVDPTNSNHHELSDNDSEDSNDENNYRNEYPDTEEDDDEYNPDDDDNDGDDDEDNRCQNLFGQRRTRRRYGYDDDEYDNDSVDENDMMKAMKSMDLDNELSDDDDDCTGNGFIYSVDSESIDFEDDVDYCDVNRYGEMYARYKARVIKRNKLEKCNESDDDDAVGDCDDDLTKDEEINHSN